MARLPSLAQGGTLQELLLVVGARLTRLQDEVLSRLDNPLTFRQYRILARVDEGHATLGALARLAHRSVPTMSQSVDTLVKRGLLLREIPPNDRRSMALSLTPEGFAALDAARRGLEKLALELTSALPEQARENLRSSLITIYEVSRAYMEEDSE